ncbi:hypothetical protein SDRG_00626 [Saprolegnia diclina VS20]|uniref:Elicitin n=1 Tax=Saprolegnia diclina (strain VS20) TaxID=1156394 RepID=T0S8Y3_SAPDV|nr:hypothetical protein SDRG_00626 [Saprolegnia diclina VS20]EQC41763.1 hypothetical protein SDRG_00626 [Saprolegnia diclina VS20]|eukprot:XP_008604332.1 hypothetical protein SDRG_00626 [Saprolegnia diclina VS20]
MKTYYGAMAFYCAIAYAETLPCAGQMLQTTLTPVLGRGDTLIKCCKAAGVTPDVPAYPARVSEAQAAALANDPSCQAIYASTQGALKDVSPPCGLSEAATTATMQTMTYLEYIQGFQGSAAPSGNATTPSGSAAATSSAPATLPTYALVLFAALSSVVVAYA